uniref:Protein kinase domain-containing protein n=1 Tax=Oryza brachyantha TaxID=4533 RepID=J3L5Y2_ORYBR
MSPNQPCLFDEIELCSEYVIYMCNSGYTLQFCVGFGYILDFQQIGHGKFSVVFKVLKITEGCLYCVKTDGCLYCVKWSIRQL